MYTDIKKKSISTRYTTWFYKKRRWKKALIVLFFTDLSLFPLDSAAAVFFTEKLREKKQNQTELSLRERGGVSKRINYKTIPIVERNLSAFVAATSL